MEEVGTWFWWTERLSILSIVIPRWTKNIDSLVNNPLEFQMEALIERMG